VSALFFALLEIAIRFRCPVLSREGFDPWYRHEYDRVRWQEYARAVKPS